VSSLRIVSGAAGATLAALLLSGCGGGSPTGSSSTTTPGGAAKTTATKPGLTATTKAAATDAVSTVKGRKYDAGVIVGTKKAGGLTILVLNRYTVKGLSDAKLASDGAPVSPHTDVRFSDQNKGKTYLVPVNPSAPIVVNTCDNSGSKPTMTSTPVTLAAFLSSANRAKTVVLLSYDELGRLTRLDTDPVC
jgi:hypothetical protein